MRTLAILLALALPAFGADIYPRVGYSGILITSVLGATDLTPAPPENPTGPAAIAGMAVDETGWILEVYINNLSTGGSYAYGFDTNNNVVAGTKVAMNATSQGFTTNGTATTLTRTVYGTKRIRKPYPDEATADEAIVGDTVKIKLALSDFVYSGDSNLTATVLEGLYVQGGTNSLAATSMTVTNRSGVAYAQPVANWALRGFRVIDTENMDLRVVAFHRDAMEGLPVRMVEFRVKDSGNNWFTNKVTAPTIDTNMPDPNPVIEYVANFATNTLAAGILECNARVYPWIGDSASVLDSVNSIVATSPYFCTLTNAVNIPRTRALVGPDGNDGTGIAATEVYWSTNTSPSKFATISLAIKAIYDTNVAVSLPGMSGGIIYLDEGVYDFFGAARSQTVKQTVEYIVTKSAAANRDLVRLTNSNDSMIVTDSDILRLKSVTIDTSDGLFFNNIMRQVWLDDVYVANANGNRVFGASTPYVGTWCNYSNIVTGLQQYSTDAMCWALIRGSRITGSVGSVVTYTFIGNAKESATTLAVRDATSATMSPPRNFPAIIAFNTFTNQAAGAMFDVGTYNEITNGFAIVQNLHEYNGTNTEIQGLSTFQADGYNTTNAIVWNNTWAGTKNNTGYNAVGTNATWRFLWSMANNIYDRKAIKSDTFTTQSGNRIGNWSLLWGVGHYGNAFVNTTNIGSADDFDHEFTGLGGWAAPQPMVTNYWKPERRGGWDGVTLHPAGGDYRIKSDSPLITRNTTKWVLPYDLVGRARATNDPPGAYSETTAP